MNIVTFECWREGSEASFRAPRDRTKDFFSRQARGAVALCVACRCIEPLGSCGNTNLCCQLTSCRCNDDSKTSEVSSPVKSLPVGNSRTGPRLVCRAESRQPARPLALQTTNDWKLLIVVRRHVFVVSANEWLPYLFDFNAAAQDMRTEIVSLRALFCPQL